MVELKDLVPGTIVIANDGRIAIVTEIDTGNIRYPVIYSFKTCARGYKGSQNDFQAILGVVDIDAWNARKRKPFVGTDSDAMVPDVLKGVRIGDRIMVVGRRGTEEATYLGYNPNRPKNCLSFEIGGKKYKGTLSLFAGKV